MQAAAGVTWGASVGERVVEGQPLFTLHTDTPERFDRALEALEGGIEVAAPGTSFTPSDVVLDRISGF